MCLMNDDVLLVKKAYNLINEKASSNVVIQGISGVLGFPLL